METSLAKSLLTCAPMGVIAIDPAGSIHSANAAAVRLFDRVLVCDPPVNIRTVLPALPLDELIDAGRLDAFNASGRSGGGAGGFETVRADGSRRIIDVQAAQIQVQGGRFITLLLRDYSKVIADEARLQDIRAQIVSSARLNSLGEMASVVAHELNQPLAAVANYLHVAKALLTGEDESQQRARRAIAAAEDQAIRATTTIKHMRTLLKQDDGLQTECRAANLVAELMPLLLIQAREVDAEVTFDVPPGEWMRCDKIQFQQLIMNLARNGFEAIRAQPVRLLTIAAAPVSDRMLEIRVEDSGAGVPADLADGLFEPRSSSKVDGMGLGLSICKTIVDAHHGVIRHAPGTNGGTVFSFTMPRARTKAA